MINTDRMELLVLITNLNGHVYDVGKILVRQLKRRDALRRQTETQCDVITKQLRKREYTNNNIIINTPTS